MSSRKSSNMQTSDSQIELFLASAHFFPTHGGAQLRYLRYIPGLRHRSVFTRVLTGTPKLKKNHPDSHNPDGALVGEEDVLSKDFINQIPIQRVSLPDRAGWRRSIAFNQAVLKFCRQSGYRPDIVQLVSSLQPRSVIWLNQLRTVARALVYAYTLPLKLPSNPVKRAIRRRTLRYLYNKMDCIIVNSPQMREQMLDLGVTVRMEFIPNGVNLARFRPAIDADEKHLIRRALGIENHATVVTTVGAVHPRKGTDLLLEAWVRLAGRYPSLHLYIVGLRKDLTYPDLTEFHRKLEKWIAESGAKDRIHFTGLVRNVEDYLRASDVFAFPSLREGMPNVVLEAMASGLPVLMTPFIGLSEELGKAGCEYLLADHDPDSIAAVLTQLIEDAGLREKLSHQARKWVADNLDIESSLDRYAGLYYELADKSPPRDAWNLKPSEIATSTEVETDENTGRFRQQSPEDSGSTDIRRRC